MKPVLLIDVDGPLNPYAAKPTKRPEGYETHRMTPSGFLMNNALRVWLNPSHGMKLLSLGCELVWATMWGTEANEWISPHIGLPDLPAVDFKHINWFDNDGLYVKTKIIAKYMNENHPGVPFAWIDDETTSRDSVFLADNCPVKSKIFQIDPRIGLLDDDFAEIKKWAQEQEKSAS